jgi:hypothetical protein
LCFVNIEVITKTLFTPETPGNNARFVYYTKVPDSIIYTTMKERIVSR